MFYVLLLELPEGLFWDADASLLAAVAESKGVFDEWLAGEQDRVRRQSAGR